MIVSIKYNLQIIQRMEKSEHSNQDREKEEEEREENGEEREEESGEKEERVSKNQQQEEGEKNGSEGDREQAENQNNQQERQERQVQRHVEPEQNSPTPKHSELSKSRSKKQEIIPSKSRSKVLPKKQSQLWKAYDFLFPGGKLSKLIKVSNVYKKHLPINQMLTKFKYNDAYPVINLIGGMENNRGKFYAGVARAAFNTDAVIVTNGIATGLEKFVLRRGVKTIGIAPEKEVKFPKINPTFVQKMELANGHTHLFLLNNPERDLSWGGEVEFKIDVALRLAEGKKKGQPNCKIVSLLVGDALFDELEEVKRSVQNDFPIIVVPGSPLCDQLIKNSADPRNSSYSNQQMKNLIAKGHFFYCNTTNSEDIAQLVHLLLVIRPW